MVTSPCSSPFPARSELTEKLVTTGDVGRPASDLARRFPLLAEQLAALPEVWWHCDPAKPNCALTKKFSCRETKQHLQVGRSGRGGLGVGRRGHALHTREAALLPWLWVWQPGAAAPGSRALRVHRTALNQASLY